MAKKYKYLFRFGHGSRAADLFGSSISDFWNDIYDAFDIEREMFVERLDGSVFLQTEIRKLFKDLAEDMEEDFAVIWLEIQNKGKRLRFLEIDILPGISLDEEEALFREYLPVPEHSQTLLSTDQYRILHFPEEDAVVLFVVMDKINAEPVQLLIDNNQKCSAKKMIVVKWNDLDSEAESLIAARKIELLDSSKMLQDINSRNLDLALIDFQSIVQGRAEEKFSKERFGIYLDFVKSATSNLAKKDSLEGLSKYFLNGVKGLRVIEKDYRGPSEEIDLLVANESCEIPLNNIGNPVAVECRHRRKPASSKDIRDFYGKLAAIGLKAGILVSLKGVTGNLYDAVGVIRDARKNGITIVVITLEDLKGVVDGKKPMEIVKECFYKYI